MIDVVFAGPSIHGLSLENSSVLTVLPPAACGDVLRAVRAGARTIGIIDGLFSAEPAIWHKEILLALSKRIRVLGASSLGALRAAECDHYGMEGVGRIYTDYRDGRRTEDADVALLHGPAELGYCPLTLPLVDAEATVEELLAREKIEPAEAASLLLAAHRLHFSERTWTDTIAGADLSAAAAQHVADAVAQHKVEQKKLDAAQLIQRMRTFAQSADDPSYPTWSLSRTYYLTVLETRTR